MRDRVTGVELRQRRVCLVNVQPTSKIDDPAGIGHDASVVEVINDAPIDGDPELSPRLLQLFERRFLLRAVVILVARAGLDNNARQPSGIGMLNKLQQNLVHVSDLVVLSQVRVTDPNLSRIEQVRKQDVRHGMTHARFDLVSLGDGARLQQGTTVKDG